jgi:hypothetical protein
MAITIKKVPCPTGSVENSDATYSTTVASGGSLTLPDSDVNVNSVNEGSVVSVKDIDINVVDSSGSVTPDSVTIVGNTVTIDVPDSSPAPAGATLMPSGQTTVYRTGDDADKRLVNGRTPDFFTLNYTNPFGNTNRFTDELGGATYANDIVIDWSTYDNVAGTVLGYYCGDTTFRTWNDAIDWGASLSVGTFTTAWRLWNIREMKSLFNYSTTRAINYAPFTGLTLNIGSSSRYVWTSTTHPTYTTNAFRGDFASWALQSQNKANANQCVATRTFTVTGTTLT